MKIFYLFLILSIVLFVIGIVNLSYSGLILLEKYPDLQIIYSGQLDPQQQITTPINVTAGEQITISILTDSKNPLFFYIEGVNQEIIVENIFSEKFSFPFLTNQSGTHIFGVGNMGNTPLQIDNYVSENPILETEVIKELEGNSLFSYFLIIFAIALFFIGLVLYFIKKIVKHKKSKNL